MSGFPADAPERRCPEGHAVSPGLRFCPLCGRHVEATAVAGLDMDGLRTTPRRRWPRRLGVVVAVVAVGGAAAAVVLATRGDGDAAPPPSTTVAPTTTVAVEPGVEGQPCAPPLAWSGDLSCQPTALGPLWYQAPFAEPTDVVGLLGDWTDGRVPASDLRTLSGMAFGAGNLSERADGGTDLWCVALSLRNYRTVPVAYGPQQLRLLDPRGNLTPAVEEVGLDPPPLERGELLPGGVVSSYVCFRPSGSTGRHAVAYQPPGGVDRILVYFDRA
jgi:hypothetical protein